MDIGLLAHRGKRLLRTFAAAAPGSRGSSSPSAASGSAVRRFRRGSSRPGRGSAGPDVGGLLPVGRPGLAFDLQLHAWAAKPIISRNRSASGVLLHERAQLHHVIGVRWRVATRSCRRSPQSRPPATALFGGARTSFAPPSYTITGDRTAGIAGRSPHLPHCGRGRSGFARS